MSTNHESHRNVIARNASLRRLSRNFGARRRFRATLERLEDRRLLAGDVVNVVDTHVFEQSIGQLLLDVGGQETLFVAKGPAAVNVFYEGNVGDAFDDNGNSRDDVLAEMVDLQFSGFMPGLGELQISLNPAQPSLGLIEELNNNTVGRLDVDPFAPGIADSFFDIFFQVNVVATGQTLVTAQPTRLVSVLNSVPPQNGERYIFDPPAPVELIDSASGLGTGIFIKREIHDPVPEIEIDVFPESIGQLLLDVGGQDVLFISKGPATVNVFFEGPNQGDATDDDLNGRDEVVTQMTDLQFTGFLPGLGELNITLNPNLPSLGIIEELLDNNTGLLDVDPFAPGDANSFFDIFFQVEVVATGQTLVTAAPTRLVSVIDTKPPENGERYVFDPPAPVELIDSASGLGTGIFIKREIHDPVPEIEIDVFPESIGQLLLDVGGQDVLFISKGPATVNVFFEGPNQGDATDDDLNGRDEVVTQMTDLQFTGFLPGLGELNITLNPNLPSLGIIEELLDNNTGLLDVDPFAPGDANSFFDIFFQVEVVATGQTLVTAAPTRLVSVIDTKPPENGERYVFDPPAPVELIDLASGLGTGIFIKREIHDPVPEIEIDVFPESIGQLLLDVGGQDVLFISKGPATVNVFFEGPNQGDATDDDLNGRDEVVTQMTDLQFTGFLPGLGELNITLNPNLPSLGIIEELLDNNTGLLDVDPFAPGDANSFFDIFFQVEVVATGQTLVTAAPTRLVSVIDTKPPENGERYVFDPPAPVELIDLASGFGTGIFIKREIHDPVPEIEIDVFPESIGQLLLDVGGQDVLFISKGPATVNVFFEGPNQGDATDDDLNGRDEVVTQMTDLQFTGFLPGLGELNITLNPNLPSLGIIEELLDNNTGLLDVDPFAPGDANSFFDIFFQVEVVATGQTLVTAAPTRLVSVIDTKPPENGERYVFDPPAPVELIDLASGFGTGIFIKREIHDPAPTVQIDPFINSSFQFELQLPGAAIENVLTSGSSQFDVYFEGAAIGNATDDDGNSRDEVVQEVVGLSTSGTSSFGPVAVSLNPALPSLGVIEEQVDNTTGTLDLDPIAIGDADSFVDLYFEIEIGSQTLITLNPLRATAIVLEKPVGQDDTFVFTGPVTLIDASSGLPSGFELNSFNFTPSDSTDVFPPSLLSFTRQNPTTVTTNADTLVFRATFSEDVQNVDATDFAVNSASTATISNLSPASASTYDITVAGGDLANFNGMVGLDLAAGQNIQDLGGNALPNGEPALDDVFSVVNLGTRRFDFDKTRLDTEIGFTSVLPTDTYSLGSGFGWVAPAAIEKFDTGAGNPDNLLRDYHFFRTASRTFRVDVPDGDYNVIPNIGSALHTFQQVGVIIDGVQVDTITTAPGDFVSNTYSVTVTGGNLQLTIERQGGTFVGINALTITPTAGAPVITTTPGAAVYPTGAPSLPIDPALFVTDSNSVNLVGGSVSITSGHLPSEDLLDFTDQNGISGSFNGPTGVLTLTGAASVADYQTALRSVAYRNSSGTPTFQTRTITFTASDGSFVGTATRDLEVFDPNALVSANFDFDKFNSPTETGFTRVLPTTTYTPGAGFGWVNPVAIEQFDTGNPDDLLRDYNFFRGGSRTFRVDVPNGNYDVTYQTGSSLHRFEKAGVILNGTQVDQVTTAPNNFQTSTYRVSVAGGRIELTLDRQGGTFIAISALSIAPVLPAPPLLAAPGFDRPDEPVALLTHDELAPIVRDAIGIWASSGLSSDEVAALESVKFVIADLRGSRLGEFTPSLIRIDDDASGFGWSSQGAEDPDQAGGMDLLTAVLHELGHVLGRDHADNVDDVMHDYLAPGHAD